MATFKERLAAGETLVGPFISLDCPDVVEAVGLAGWDFALVDCEHSPLGSDTVGNIGRACAATGMNLVVRVPGNEEWLINKALDAGAEAVVVPQIDGIESARRAATSAKYAPRGTRGANPFTRAGRFQGFGGLDFYANANRDTMLILMVEGVGGANDIHEIASLESVDALFFGPVDFSHSLGVPGQIDHPKVIETITRLMSVAREHGKAIGVFANDVQRARFWMDRGAQFIAFGVDINIIFKAFQGLATELKKR